jgi:hypothetical protein
MCVARGSTYARWGHGGGGRRGRGTNVKRWIRSRPEAWAGVWRTYPHSQLAAQHEPQMNPGQAWTMRRALSSSSISAPSKFSFSRQTELAWARGLVEVFAIGAVPADCRAAAGVAHEGVVGGEDGAEGEGVVIWVLGSAMGGRPGVAHVSAGSCA